MANDCGAANRERVVKRAAGTAIVLLTALLAATSPPVASNPRRRRRRPKTPRRAGENAVQHALRRADFLAKGGGRDPRSGHGSQQARWALNIAVVDFGGHLVSFPRMGGGQLASIVISEHTARASAKFRRPTRFFEDAVQRGAAYLATLDDVVASRGGIPLIGNGKLVGAISCSGGTGSQEEAVYSAGAATINK
jgi:uncharacterized protein GlcG (DUF336 family)